MAAPRAARIWGTWTFPARADTPDLGSHQPREVSSLKNKRTVPTRRQLAAATPADTLLGCWTQQWDQDPLGPRGVPQGESGGQEETHPLCR